ncbi:MAG TPA: hypothetical protein VM100_08390 [Longimicrobiales bacterium]|nr:hypothetical protein [Longimicrobiales bacterium]
MVVAGSKNRLLANHAFALHFAVSRRIVVNVPVTPEQLNGFFTFILDVYVINENEARLLTV